MRETLVALLVALLVLYVLSRSKWGADKFFLLRGSVGSS